MSKIPLSRAKAKSSLGVSKMGYKGHPGVSDTDVGNVPPSNPELGCHDCDETERLESMEGEWAYKRLGDSYEQIVRCPECQDGTEDGYV